MKSILYLLLLLPLYPFAQFHTDRLLDLDSHMYSKQTEFGVSEYRGHPFLNDEWREVIVKKTNGTEVQIAKSKLDIWKQRLFIINKGQEIIVNNSEIGALSYGSNDGSPSTFIKTEIDGTTTYAEILKKGQIALYKTYHKKFNNRTKNKDSNGYNSPAIPAFSSTKSSLYISISGESPVAIRRSKKGLEKALPPYLKKSIKTLLKKTNPNLKNDDELIAFLDILEKEMP